MSEAAPDSAAYVVPDGTGNLAGGTKRETESVETDATWQTFGGEGGVRNASDSSTTRTNWLSASPSTVTPGDEVTVRFTRSGHGALTTPRAQTLKSGPWMG